MSKEEIKKIAKIILIIAIIDSVMFIGIKIWENMDRYEYTELQDGTYELTRYIGKKEEVTIPSEYKGRPVTSIGRWVFCRTKHCIRKVNIPNTVTRIEERAFSSRIWLCEITGGESVNYVGEYAFYGCGELSSIPFDKNLTYIGDHAFENCIELKEFRFSKSLKYLGQKAFYETCIEEVTIPESIQYIGSDALMRTLWMNKQENPFVIVNDFLLYIPRKKEIVVIPEGVKVISDSIKVNEKIKELYIPRSTVSIGKNLLYYDNNVPIRIYIPSSVENIGYIPPYEEFRYENSLCIYKDTTLVVEKGSYAEKYAKMMHYDYEVVDKIEYPDTNN